MKEQEELGFVCLEMKYLDKEKFNELTKNHEFDRYCNIFAYDRFEYIYNCPSLKKWCGIYSLQYLDKEVKLINIHRLEDMLKGISSYLKSCKTLNLKEEKEMKTKVTVLGEAEAVKPELKKIEFVKWIDGSGVVSSEGMATKASNWDNIELICRNYRDGGFDLLFCYDGDNRNGCNKDQEQGFTGYTQILVLGHFNDGVVL